VKRRDALVNVDAARVCALGGFEQGEVTRHQISGNAGLGGLEDATKGGGEIGRGEELALS